MKSNNTIMIFGVFDNFHEGHRFFIEEALKNGAEIVIVVARDKTVKQIKGHTTKWHELKRAEILRQNYPAATVVLGDEELGSYKVVQEHKPDVICLGYDQDALAHDLEAKMKAGTIKQVKIIRVKAHRPEEYKSSKYA